MLRPVMVTCVLALAAGCEDAPPQRPRNFNTGAPIGSSNAEELKAWVSNSLKLTNVTLTNVGGNDFEGTGQNAKGETCQLKITQTPGNIACDYSSPSGKKMTMSASSSNTGS